MTWYQYVNTYLWEIVGYLVCCNMHTSRSTPT